MNSARRKTLNEAWSMIEQVMEDEESSLDCMPGLAVPSPRS